MPTLYCIEDMTRRVGGSGPERESETDRIGQIGVVVEDADGEAVAAAAPAGDGAGELSAVERRAGADLHFDNLRLGDLARGVNRTFVNLHVDVPGLDLSGEQGDADGDGGAVAEFTVDVALNRIEAKFFPVGADAADTENSFLQDAGFVVAPVKAVCNGPGSVGIARNLGVEQKQLHVADFSAPGAQIDVFAGDFDADQNGITGVVHG